MSDLLQPRRSRRPPLVLAGSVVFALLAVLTGLDAARGLAPGPEQGGIGLQEATIYRICASAICAALAVWIFVAGGPRRTDDASLLR